MTRSASTRSGNVLNLNAYIHQATLHLPGSERLDAAAELRTHLLEQISVLEAKGFPHEEAEFLAVEAMGPVPLSTRSVVSRTRILGWTVLGLMSLATGLWWAYNNLMPPNEGIEVTGSDLTENDMARLWYNPDAPHGINAYYNTAVLTYPKTTRTIYYAYVTPKSVVIKSNALTNDNAADVSQRWPGSYRYQERWLLSSKEGNDTCPLYWKLFLSVQALPSSLSFTEGAAGSAPDLKLGQLGSGRGDCTTPTPVPTPTPVRSGGWESRPESHVIMGGVLPLIQEGSETSSVSLPLPLGRWTILSQYMTVRKVHKLNDLPATYNNSVYLAVLPTDQDASPSDAGAVFKRDASGDITHLTYGGQPLPDPPAGSWGQIRRSLMSGH